MNPATDPQARRGRTRRAARIGPGRLVAPLAGLGLVGVLLPLVLIVWQDDRDRLGPEADDASPARATSDARAQWQGVTGQARGSTRPWPPRQRRAPHRSNQAAPEQETARILAGLRRQGIPTEDASALTRQEIPLSPQTLGHLADALNWMPELMKASSTVMARGDGAPSLLTIDSLATDSILHDLGVMDGDLIALIDGEIPCFSPACAFGYIRQASAGVSSLEQGAAVSLTLLRGGRPIHLVYSRW